MAAMSSGSSSVIALLPRGQTEAFTLFSRRALTSKPRPEVFVQSGRIPHKPSSSVSEKREPYRLDKKEIKLSSRPVFVAKMPLRNVIKDTVACPPEILGSFSKNDQSFRETPAASVSRGAYTCFGQGSSQALKPQLLEEECPQVDDLRFAQSERGTPANTTRQGTNIGEEDSVAYLQENELSIKGGSCNTVLPEGQKKFIMPSEATVELKPRPDETIWEVQSVEDAREVVQLLMTKHRDKIHACDTEVTEIDVKKESPVGHGRIVCFSIYCGPGVDIGRGHSQIWVDVLEETEAMLLAFRPYFEDPGIQKVWHNYSFDYHILMNHGINPRGFHADTMHLARLWNTSRKGKAGGYSLASLTTDRSVMNGRKTVENCRDLWDEEDPLAAKSSMKKLFGKSQLLKSGHLGKTVVIPPIHTIQIDPNVRAKWIQYSVYDAVSTWFLWRSLNRKLTYQPIYEWESSCTNEQGSLYEFYQNYWRPFGEVLVRMEREGMLVDREHLAAMEKKANQQQKASEDSFRKWAMKYSPDAQFMNVGSDPQLRQLLFGGCENSKTKIPLPIERVFSVPNTTGFIEEGKKVPKKNRPITLRRIESSITVENRTVSGWPAISGKVLQRLAGVSYDYTMIEEEDDSSSDEAEIQYNSEGEADDIVVGLIGEDKVEKIDEKLDEKKVENVGEELLDETVDSNLAEKIDGKLNEKVDDHLNETIDESKDSGEGMYRQVDGKNNFGVQMSQEEPVLDRKGYTEMDSDQQVISTDGKDVERIIWWDIEEAEGMLLGRETPTKEYTPVAELDAVLEMGGQKARDKLLEAGGFCEWVKSWNGGFKAHLLKKQGLDGHITGMMGGVSTPYTSNIGEVSVQTSDKEDSDDTDEIEEDLSKYGKAYEAFGKGKSGKEACWAFAALFEVSAINTLLSNFLLPLQGQEIMGPTGRIHCSLNLNTETGRLSARRPSLQNQPGMEKDRYYIRRAFQAADGNTLIVADYGQLELRILAHLAECKSMLTAFKAGGDFHSRTALNMYPHVREAVEKGEVILEWDPQPGQEKPPVPLLKDKFRGERQKAKMLNFSIAYGKTVMGLGKDWKVSRFEAAKTVNLWYSDRPEVKKWQEERIAEAKKTKKVRTLLGRPRDLPDINHKEDRISSHFERAAINTPVQGSAADIAMLAMLRLDANAELAALGYKLLLQVHDEVILEGPEEHAKRALEIVLDCMQKPFPERPGDFTRGKNPLLLELVVDAKYAKNWYSAK